MLLMFYGCDVGGIDIEDISGVLIKGHQAGGNIFQ
jgi:hypothetical protein